MKSHSSAPLEKIQYHVTPGNVGMFSGQTGSLNSLGSQFCVTQTTQELTQTLTYRYRGQANQLSVAGMTHVHHDKIFSRIT